jgi:cyclohexanecarboxylate-CoA ligase
LPWADQARPPSRPHFLERPALTRIEKAKLAQRQRTPNDVVELIYTSGTSGEPKAVMHTANTVLAAAQGFVEDIPVGRADVVFMGSPYAHQTGFLYGILMPIMLAGKTVALDQWSAVEAAPLIEGEGATFSMGSTPFLSDLVNLPQMLRSKVSTTLRTWVVCRRADTPPVVERARNRNGARRALLLGHDGECRPHHNP